MTRVLPPVLRPGNKYKVGWSLFALAAIVYLIPNHFHFYEPRLLPLSWLDQAIPFMPNTVWIYVSEWAFFAAIYICVRDAANANKFIYSYAALQSFSCLIFWIFPTTFPRGVFPLPEDLNLATRWFFSFLRGVDTPANCFPSLHVSSVFLCSFIYLEDRRRLFPFFFVWAAAISVSTLTTKQHYVADVASGFAMAIVFYYIFHRFFTYAPANGDQAKR
ncbi:MAG: phosphatase PAP2 family protein [Bdellovibrionota bacterium]